MNFIDLPSDCHHLIAKWLPLNDQFRLRAVCRSLNALILQRFACQKTLQIFGCSDDLDSYYFNILNRLALHNEPQFQINPPDTLILTEAPSDATRCPLDFIAEFFPSVTDLMLCYRNSTTNPDQQINPATLLRAWTSSLKTLTLKVHYNSEIHKEAYLELWQCINEMANLTTLHLFGFIQFLVPEDIQTLGQLKELSLSENPTFFSLPNLLSQLGEQMETLRIFHEPHREKDDIIPMEWRDGITKLALIVEHPYNILQFIGQFSHSCQYLDLAALSNFGVHTNFQALVNVLNTFEALTSLRLDLDAIRNYTVVSDNNELHNSMDDIRFYNSGSYHDDSRDWITVKNSRPISHLCGRWYAGSHVKLTYKPVPSIKTLTLTDRRGNIQIGERGIGLTSNLENAHWRLLAYTFNGIECLTVCSLHAGNRLFKAEIKDKVKTFFGKVNLKFVKWNTLSQVREYFSLLD